MKITAKNALIGACVFAIATVWASNNIAAVEDIIG